MLHKPNNKDPLVSREQLIQTLFGDLPLANERLLMCMHKRYVTKIDLLYLEEKLRAVQCAVIALAQVGDHDKPLELP